MSRSLMNVISRSFRLVNEQYRLDLVSNSDLNGVRPFKSTNFDPRNARNAVFREMAQDAAGKSSLRVFLTSRGLLCDIFDFA